MFKRVARRIKKKEEEEALGLNEDMKEVLGMHDTDSDESDSDSSSDAASSSADEEDDTAPATAKRKHDAVGRDDESDSEESGVDVAQFTEEDADEVDELEEDVESDEETEEAPMTLEQALRDPIFIVALQPEEKACLVCPGKLLKNAVMVDVHRTSNVSVFLQATLSYG
jgi:hypothetical protein